MCGRGARAHEVIAVEETPLDGERHPLTCPELARFPAPVLTMWFIRAMKLPG